MRCYIMKKYDTTFVTLGAVSGLFMVKKELNEKLRIDDDD